jgi:DNA-directed RNA polymerase specialized sigma24 family protein
MTKRREVGDEELRAKLADKDVRTLVAFETAKYRAVLDEHQRESAARVGVWRCLQYHREGFGQKFTTNLVRFLHYELRRELKVERRRSGFGVLGRHPDDVSDLSELLSYGGRADELFGRERLAHACECMLRYLPRRTRRMLRQFFFGGYTVDEISRMHGCTKGRAQERINKGLRQLRELCGDEPSDPPPV